MKVELVSGSDWQGLYVNGILITQNHRLVAFDVLDALESSSIEVSYSEVDEDWINERGGLPRELNDVVKVEEPNHAT